MSFLKLTARAALIAATALIATGCANHGGEYSVLSEIGGSESMLRLYGTPLKTASPHRVAFATPWEYEEYAGLRTNEFRLEIIYIRQVGNQTSVRYPYSMAKMAETWRHNAGQAKRWGEDDRIHAPIGEVWYWHYAIARRSESCAVFQTEWDHPADDPDHWPGKVIFGYLCAAPGKSLTDVTIEEVLSGIGVRGVTERIRKSEPAQLAMDFGARSNAPAATRTGALAVAKGVDGGKTGNIGFPFGFVFPYTPDDGEDPLLN